MAGSSHYHLRFAHAKTKILVVMTMAMYCIVTIPQYMTM